MISEEISRKGAMTFFSSLWSTGDLFCSTVLQRERERERSQPATGPIFGREWRVSPLCTRPFTGADIPIGQHRCRLHSTSGHLDAESGSLRVDMCLPNFCSVLSSSYLAGNFSGLLNAIAFPLCVCLPPRPRCGRGPRRAFYGDTKKRKLSPSRPAPFSE